MSNTRAAVTATTERLAAVPFLADCAHLELLRIERLATVVHVPVGRVLMEQGRFGHDFAIVLSGSADVLVDGETVGTLRSGDFFGEVSLLTDQPRTATVRTTSPTELAVIAHNEFRQLLVEAPNATRGMLHAVAARSAADSGACHPPGH